MNAPAFGHFTRPPLWYAANARALACCSAAGFNTLPMNFKSIAGFLNSGSFLGDTPLENGIPDWNYACRPYRFRLNDGPNGPQFHMWMSAWARGGIRYIARDLDLLALTPQSFYGNWWQLYREAFPDIPPDSIPDQIFTRMFESMGTDEDHIVGNLGHLILDPRRIRKILR